MKSVYRTSLTAAKKDQLLTKIKALVDERPSRFVLDRGRERFHGAELTGIVISPSSATGTVVFNAGAAYGVTAASKEIQDLTYAAKAQADGFFPNDVTIRYADPADPVPGLSVAVNGRDILVTLDGDAAVKASKVIQDLTFEAVAAGVGGNSITIKYTAGGVKGSEVVGVVGNAITVTMADASSTAAEIRAALLLSAPAMLLVSVTVSGTGTDAQDAFTPAVALENGAAYALVSTATEVKAAIEAKAEAAALVAITVSGTGSDVQTVQIKTALAGGTSLQSYDKADMIGFRRLRTHRWAIELTADADPS
jgi:hypothetical protein